MENFDFVTRSLGFLPSNQTTALTDLIHAVQFLTESTEQLSGTNEQASRVKYAAAMVNGELQSFLDQLSAKD